MRSGRGRLFCRCSQTIPYRAPERPPSPLKVAEAVLVTGAAGQIGSKLSSLLRAAGHRVVAVDLRPSAPDNVEPCDIRSDDQIARLFDSASIRTVVHLAAVLPTAFRADPIAATEVNLTGTLRL